MQTWATGVLPSCSAQRLAFLAAQISCVLGPHLRHFTAGANSAPEGIITMQWLRAMAKTEVRHMRSKMSFLS